MGSGRVNPPSAIAPASRSARRWSRGAAVTLAAASSILFATATPAAPGDPRTPAAPAPPGDPPSPANTRRSAAVFLRIANLLPLGSPTVDVRRGTTPLRTGLKPGCLMGYTDVSALVGTPLAVFQEGRKIGEIALSTGDPGTFYTAVIVRQDNRPTLLCGGDAPPPPHPPEPAEAARFLRLYLGTFDFPYVAEAGGLGRWEVRGTPVVAVLPVTVEPPPAIRISYRDRAGRPATITGPVQFDAGVAGVSVFVSQRGPHRLRIRCYPDGMAPVTEEENPAIDGP